jgi:ACT domain
VPTYVVRVWVPDRPGALGQVASRVGAVRGDVVGIEILERGGGRAIDEFVVTLPESGLLDLLLSELSQVDGVDVEDVRSVEPGPVDRQLAALESAARIVEARTRDLLCANCMVDFESDWAVALDLEHTAAVAAHGHPPEAAWLAAFLAGSRHLVDHGGEKAGPDDLAWAELERSRLAVAVGRRNRPYRDRERRQLAALVRIADAALALTDVRIVPHA